METTSPGKSRMGRDPTRIISDLLKAFINIPVDRIDEEITNTLKFLASHVGGVDRCALYLLSEADNGTTTISNTHEWVKNKKFSRIASQQRVPIDSSTFYTNFFVWGDHLPIYGPSNMSPVEKAGDDASTPPPASQLYIPITSKNKIIGAIGLSSFKKARPWSKEETSFLALIGEIIVTAIDRKNMELAMFTREKYYRSITRSIPVGLLVFKVELDTADLRLVDENPAARTITDAYTSGCIGKTIEQAFPFLVDSGIPEILKNVAMAGTSWSSDGVEFTFQGTTRAYQIAAFQIAPREVAAAFLDVTSQKEMERLLAQENEKLKEIDKMRDEFVATTTHELKTPLVSLIGATEFLLRNFTSLDDEQVLNLIEISYRGSTRLKALINDLLTVYRIESGGISLDTKEIDLVDIIGRVMKDTSFLVKARKQEVVFNPPDKAL
ncbi:MAG: hypothetical protein GYA24_10650, partial [Candidatus Lokiarchaeota archaeon]|nr:hypothetical protein [Candidatus Lokiarchaeota archaeon]